MNIADYEPSIPKLNITLHNKESDLTVSRSNNNSIDLRRTSLNAPLSPINEEAPHSRFKRPNQTIEDEEPEPLKPETNYQYDKFRTEAKAFVKGAHSANKLQKITEKVNVSSAYLKALLLRKQGLYIEEKSKKEQDA